MINIYQEALLACEFPINAHHQSTELLTSTDSIHQQSLRLIMINHCWLMLLVIPLICILLLPIDLLMVIPIMTNPQSAKSPTRSDPMR